MWIAFVIIAAIAAFYLYLAFTCFFTQVTFLAAYRTALDHSGSRKTALRKALDVFAARPPFDVLDQSDLDRLVEVFDLIPNPMDVAKIVRAVDRRRDAAQLKDRDFLTRLEKTYHEMAKHTAA